MEIKTKIAAPSLGKTFGAVQWIKRSQDKFIIASISLLLCNQTKDLLLQQCPDKKILLITSAENYINGVLGRFKEALEEDWDVILISHKCLEMTYKEGCDFSDWNLIIDEVPSDLVEVSSVKQLVQDETTMITQFLICTGTKTKGNESRDVFRLKAGMHKDLEDRVEYLKSSGQKTISAEMKDLYEYLLLGGAVQRWQDSTNLKEATYLYIKIINPLELFKTFKRVTLIAANVEKTLVGVVWKEIFKVKFSDEDNISLRYDTLPNTDKITIYPLLPTGNNMSRYILEKGGDKEGNQVFKVLLEKGLDFIGDSPFIYAINNYREEDLKRGDRVPVKAHGLNRYSHIHNVLILFSYNPNDFTRDILVDLAEHFKLDKDIFVNGFITTNYLESSFQISTRGSIRQHDSTTPVNVIVGDTRCAEYLIDTWFTDAKVDDSLRIEIYDKRVENKGRPKNSFPSKYHMDKQERDKFYKWQRKNKVKFSLNSEKDCEEVLIWLTNIRNKEK